MTPWEQLTAALRLGTPTPGQLTAYELFIEQTVARELDIIPDLYTNSATAITRDRETFLRLDSDPRAYRLMERVDDLLTLREVCAIWLAH